MNVCYSLANSISAFLQNCLLFRRRGGGGGGIGTCGRGARFRKAGFLSLVEQNITEVAKKMMTRLPSDQKPTSERKKSGGLGRFAGGGRSCSIKYV